MSVSENENMDIDEETYCICKQPYDSSKPMVQCKDCMEWFHYPCIGLTFDPNKKIYSDEFDCQICAQIRERKKASKKIRRFVRKASDYNELHTILKRIPLENVKDFVTKQIHQIGDLNLDLLLSKKEISLNDALPDDIIHSVMSFDSNQKSTSVVCKRWKKISDTVKSIQTREQTRMLREQLQNDKQEKGLTVRINALINKKGKLRNCVSSQFELDKKKLENQFKIEKVEELRKLSAFQCSECGEGGNDKRYETCSRELCVGCMMICETGLCDAWEYFCADECAWNNLRNCADSDCDVMICSVCSTVGYEWCDKKLCDDCIVRHVQESDEMYQEDTVTQICKECEEMEKYRRY